MRRFYLLTLALLLTAAVWFSSVTHAYYGNDDRLDLLRNISLTAQPYGTRLPPLAKPPKASNTTNNSTTSRYRVGK
jgi:hypothetical protein